MKCLSCANSWQRTKLIEYITLLSSCPKCGSRFILRNDLLMAIYNFFKKSFFKQKKFWSYRIKGRRNMIILIVMSMGVTIFCFLYGYYSYGILSSISAYLFFNGHYYLGFMPLLWGLWNLYGTNSEKDILFGNKLDIIMVFSGTFLLVFGIILTLIIFLIVPWFYKTL